MQISLRCLPVGALPYTDIKLATKMMTKLFEESPYLPFFPNVDEAKENAVYLTFDNIPGIKIKERGIYLKHDTDAFVNALSVLDGVYNKPTLEGLEQYKTDTFFSNQFFKIVDKIKPKEAVVNILGPFSFAQMIKTKEDLQLLSDNYYRKFIDQAICVKALWYIKKIKALSPDTTPIIILEEPLFYRYGEIRRGNELVTKDTIVNMYSKIFQKIHENRSAVGVQSFEKCDWQVILEAGADLISFDAYNNPNNISIIADKINNYLVGGGYINWAIVPVKTESMAKTMSIDFLLNRYIATVEGLITSGVSERLAYNRAIVSVQGNVDRLPLIFAEKSLILSTQLAKRVPRK